MYDQFNVDIYSDVVKRKKATKICCIMLIIIYAVIAGLFRGNNNLSIVIKIILGLTSSLLLTTLTSFIVISLVESYPHTVRTLAYCLFVSMEFFGRFSCVIMIYTVKNTMTQHIVYIEALIVVLLYMMFLK